MSIVEEPRRHIPVIAEADLCVVGGSCTGVFAAVRAARLGASVVLVERSNCFGGTATNGLVLIWHSLLDTEFRHPIVGGLTAETIDRLVSRNAAVRKAGSSEAGCWINTEELKIELDTLVREQRVQPMLHTQGCLPLMEGDRISALAIENKDGRGAIRAKMFIDATGDGDVAVRSGVPWRERDRLQPPTTCAKIRNFRQTGMSFADIYRQHHAEFGLAPDSGWDAAVPGLPDVWMVAQTHVFNVNAARADQLTDAEIEGRRQIRAIMDMLRTYAPDGDDIALVQLASALGIRETRVLEAAHCLTEQEVLHGVRFPDAIANGSYRVDVHAPEGGGFLFKYLDGRTLFAHGNGNREGRWREPTPENPTFYQIPYRCLYHPMRPNLLCAGRMISTDGGAFGAVRVMVNTNQTGEAAGVAAVLALHGSAHSVAHVDPQDVRRTLARGGSIMR